jgi:phosphatidate cytidylyltransferase
MTAILALAEPAGTMAVRALEPFRFGREAYGLLAGIVGLLIVASLVGAALSLRVTTPRARATVDNLIARTNAWWAMVIVFTIALAGGPGGVVLLFAFLSFHALREVVTLTPTRRGDHRALFWAFFVALPLQYVVIFFGWYGLFTILIPVYGFLFFAIRSAVCGDCTRYLERAAKVFWALMIAVYCLGHVPALLMLRLPGNEGGEWKLIVFLVFVAQLSDVLQYVWGKLIGKHKIVPSLSPNKTTEGYVGGTLSATLLGGALGSAAGFSFLPSLGLALAITQMGFCGGLVMSAIKRDAGVKDYGHLIPGHGGAMDRVDSLAFAAPVFFHLVRYFYDVPIGV